MDDIDPKKNRVNATVLDVFCGQVQTIEIVRRNKNKIGDRSTDGFGMC